MAGKPRARNWVDGGNQHQRGEILRCARMTAKDLGIMRKTH